MSSAGASRPRCRMNAKMAYKNQILASLDTQTLGQLEPHLVGQMAPAQQVLVKQGSKYECVYFVEHGLLACSTTFENGDEIGVGYIGCEGAAGITGVLSDRAAPHQVETRTAVKLFKLQSSYFRAIVHRFPALRKILDIYVDALITSVQLDVACFALHPLEARISTGLAIASDATGQSLVEGTQEQIASYLGVQRTSITNVARTMESGGIVRVARGSMQIQDREGLEKSACGCYRRRADLWADVWGT